jgi:hypothetical protein
MFTPAGGGAVEERTGRLLVSSDGWARFDVKQAGAPEVTFAYDLMRGLLGGGLSDAPDTWTWSPWAVASRLAGSVRTSIESQPECVPPDAVFMDGVPCRLSECRGGGTVSREWYSPQFGLPLRMESTSGDGTRLFRIYDIRQHEPDVAEWPTSGE